MRLSDHGAAAGGRDDSRDLREWTRAYLDDELAPAERSRFEARLAADEALRAGLAAQQGVRSLLRELPRRSVPASLALPFERLLERLDAEPAPELRRLLGLLPRARAPRSLERRVFAALRASRPVAFLARRGLVAQLAAAALLAVTALGLFHAAQARVQPPQRPGALKIVFVDSGDELPRLGAFDHARAPDRTGRGAGGGR